MCTPTPDGCAHHWKIESEDIREEAGFLVGHWTGACTKCGTLESAGPIRRKLDRYDYRDEWPEEPPLVL